MIYPKRMQNEVEVLQCGFQQDHDAGECLCAVRARVHQVRLLIYAWLKKVEPQSFNQSKLMQTLQTDPRHLRNADLRCGTCDALLWQPPSKAVSHDHRS